jgi:hypothetical protein
LQAVATLLNSNPKHWITRQVAASLVVLMPLMLVEFPLFTECLSFHHVQLVSQAPWKALLKDATCSFWQQFYTEFFFCPEHRMLV